MVQPALRFLEAATRKKFYVNCLAAGLRAKDSVMTTATTIQENAEDILAEANEINRQRREAAEFCKEPEEEMKEEAEETDSLQ